MTCLVSSAFPVGAWAQLVPKQGSFHVVGQTGSWVAQSQDLTYSSESGAQFTWQNTARTLDVNILTQGASWNFGIATPFEDTGVANYTRATRYPFQASTVPGLDVGGDGRGCNRSRGTFQIYLLERNILDGNIVRMAATFDQSCYSYGEGYMPPIHGEITLGGAQLPNPRPTLNEKPTYPNPNAVPGYLNLRSDPQESTGHGLDYSLSAERLDAFAWEHSPTEYYGVEIYAAAADSSNNWIMQFAAPGNKKIVPGKYESSPFGENNPGSTIRVMSGSSSCGGSGGTLEVFLADYGTDGKLKRFDAYFEQRCTDRAAALRGEIRVGIPGDPAVHPPYPLVPAYYAIASDAGSYVGKGNNYLFSSDEGDLIDWWVKDDHLQLLFSDPYSPFHTLLTMRTGGGQFVPGAYDLATRFSAGPGKPALDVGVASDGCGQSKGFFDVLVADYRPDGTAEGFEAKYEIHCEGSSSRVIGHLRLGIAAPLSPLPKLAPLPAYMTVRSQPGDAVGAGGSYSLSAEKGQLAYWGGTRSLENLLPIDWQPGKTDRWSLVFKTPGKAAAGNYTGLNSTIASQTAGFSIYGHGRACEQQTGNFEILEAVYGRAGTLVRFHALFDQKCIESTEGLTGEIKIGIPGALEEFPPGSAPAPGTVPGGPVRLWGSGAFGSLGDGTVADSSVPVAPAGIAVAGGASAGFLHSLAVTAEGTVMGWGYNAYTQTGIPAGAQIDRPQAIPNFGGAQNVSAGLIHSLALKKDGTVYGWGWNGFGLVGDGTTSDRSAPTRAAGLTSVTKVSAGALHSLALRSDGTVWAWGWNGFGQIGDGTHADRTTPVRVPGLHDVIDISAGWYHNLALTRDGTLYSWGWNGVGQIGDGTKTDRPSPVVVASNIEEISAGLAHSLAITTKQTAMAWGWNALGQLGDGTTVDRSSPVPICLPECGWSPIRPKQLSAGGVHTLATTTDGKVWSWGWNWFGQLGDGTTIDRNLPKPVMPQLTASDISAGFIHSLLVSR
jgi:alpha-tubulin suppressor-like RCC1 family protein